MGLIVAIDGPAGSGKGTITKLVAKRLNLIAIDTGAMYRCITLYMIENNISIDEDDQIKKMLDEIKIEQTEENGEAKFLLKEEDVSKKIRSKEVNNLVSQVSHLVEVRKKMVELQRKLAIGKNVIMEGRDIGTNVFPNADVKIYLDATPEERAMRRLKQNQEKGILDQTYEEILENVKFRDNNDKTSKVAPLKQAEDAIYIDSSEMTIQEVVTKIINFIENRYHE